LSSQNEKRRKQYAEDKDYREAILARNRAFRVAHRDEINARARPEKRLAQVYGLSPQDYDAMLAEQGGVCAICKTRPDKPLFVDHSHATGKVRGLLCRPCNFSLGFMRDDPRLTAAATEYLLKAAARDDKPT
jgi:Recombination endonuclease VII